MKKALYFLLGCMLFSCSSVDMHDVLDQAVERYESGDLPQAKILIDSCFGFPGMVNDPYALLYGGYIYKDIYSENEQDSIQSPARITAITAFTRFLDTDSANAHREEVNELLEFLASTLFNDAANSLDEETYKRAIENYELYLATMKQITPDEDRSKQEIQFNMALANVLMQISKDNDNEYTAQARNCLQQVLEIDQDNYKANYNMGRSYYNVGVNRIFEWRTKDQKELAAEVDLSDPNSEIPSLQELLGLLTVDALERNKITAVFNDALPYFEKAYEIDSTDNKLLVGLAGTYFALNNLEKSNYFEERLAALAKPQ